MNNNNTAMTCTYIGTGQGCTQHAQAGSSYCAEHYAMVYKVGSGRVRKKDNRQANRVRMVEQLFQEAIDQLIAEGFDVYGDTELVPETKLQEFDDR
jgi:hypothetical protein